MGLFVSRRVTPHPFEVVLKDAYQTEATAPAEAAKRAARVAATASLHTHGQTHFHVARIVWAVMLLISLLLVALAADSFQWVDDPTHLYGLVEAALVAVVGYLGGEAVGSSTTSTS